MTAFFGVIPSPVSPATTSVWGSGCSTSLFADLLHSSTSFLQDWDAGLLVGLSLASIAYILVQKPLVSLCAAITVIMRLIGLML